MWRSTYYRNNILDKIKIRIKNGTHKGWITRNKISYAENYFITVLTNLGLDFKREHKVGKYFIDFAFINYKIALEIDGKQHELPDRKEADRIKDIFLTSLGWKIFRIKWYNPFSKNKNKLYSQIEEFKELLKSISSYNLI